MKWQFALTLAIAGAVSAGRRRACQEDPTMRLWTLIGKE